MKYKVETLKVGADKTIDIPDGCIPVKYDCSAEKRYPIISFVRTVTVLTPIKEKDISEKDISEKDISEKDTEKKCFFCDENYTRDKVGIRPICPICLGILYGMAKESHKSQEC